MSRAPSLDEALVALRHTGRLTRVDHALSLAYEGWSHGTCLDYAFGTGTTIASGLTAQEREKERARLKDAASSLLDAYAEELDLYAHGIQPPTSDRKSKRKRHREVTAFDPLARYRE